VTFNPNLKVEKGVSLDSKKQQISKNLIHLEQHGIVLREDNYQRILDAITSDIKAQRSRQTDRERYNKNLRLLTEKSNRFRAQIDAYNLYLDSCLRNLEVGKRRSFHDDDDNTSSIRISKSADRLQKKGVLLDLENCPKNQWKHVVLEFAGTGQPGELQITFNIHGGAADKIPPSAILYFQELLRLQHSGVSVCRASIATFSVRALVQWINKNVYLAKLKK